MWFVLNLTPELRLYWKLRSEIKSKAELTHLSYICVSGTTLSLGEIEYYIVLIVTKVVVFKKGV